MTAVDEATDVDTFLDVDLDKPVACIWDDCQEPAAWREVNQCESRHSLSLCTRHKGREKTFQEQHCDDLVCKFCEDPLPHPHADWIQL